MSFIFTTNDHIENIRQLMKMDGGIWAGVRDELKRRSEEASVKGPWSVVFTPGPAPSGSPNDYCSEGLYWWPDPGNPDGPYIRRDGLINPHSFNAHREALKALSETVLCLCCGGYFLNEKKYLDRAAELLGIWFLDAGTRMNPHGEYAQGIRGICTGRGVGSIDFTYMFGIVHSLGYLELYDHWKEVTEGMKEWLRLFSNWLHSSPKGLEARSHGNNITTWWAVQVASYSAFSGNEAVVAEILDFFRTNLISRQMDKDGSFPMETERSRSLHYSLFNLNAYAMLCELAFYRDIDLWSYKTPDGKGMETGIMYHLPAMNNLGRWEHPQIFDEDIGDQLAFQLAALRLGMEECASANIKRRKGHSLLRDQFPIGPLVFLPGWS